MKLFLSADIEGTAGIARWDEARQENPEYGYFRRLMTQEVAAACRGALAAGAEEVLVKDAHGTACNILPAELPEGTRLARGWQMSPLLMMEGVDGGFDGVIFTGYHSAGSENGNPLSHTISSSQVDWVRINGQLCSEFILNAYTAAYYGLPVCFLSGDAQLCGNAEALVPGITTVATTEGHGGSATSIHPATACRQIEAGVKAAVEALPGLKPLALPDRFSVQVRFKDHPKARKGSFYPGAKLVEEKTIALEADDYFDVLRFLVFVIM